MKASPFLEELLAGSTAGESGEAAGDAITSAQKSKLMGRRGDMRGRDGGKHMCGEGKNVLATTAPSKTTTTMGV